MGDVEDSLFLDLDNIIDTIISCPREDIEYVATQLNNFLNLLEE